MKHLLILIIIFSWAGVVFGQPGMGRGYGQPGFIIRDDFINDVAAGGFSGAALNAVPGPGTRAAVDTDGTHMSITGGKLTFNGGKASPGFGDPGLWLGATTRAPGLMMLYDLTITSGSFLLTGFDANQSGSVSNDTSLKFGTTIAVQSTGGPSVSALSTSTDYKFCHALLATGCMFFIKGGAYSTWTLLYRHEATATATQYPAIANYDMVLSSDFLRVPTQKWLPSPVLSDGFGGTRTGLGTSNGLGHAETTGLGSGGSGLAWTLQNGTWDNTSVANEASCSAVTGQGFATVDCGKKNVFIQAALKRPSAGNVGVVVRYVDANNYIYAYHDGTNLKLHKMVSGSDSEVGTAAKAYSAGALLSIQCDGSAFRVFYNGVQLAATAYTISDVGNGAVSLQNSTLVGVYTDTAGNSIDNIACWARGSNNEYSILDTFAVGN